MILSGKDYGLLQKHLSQVPLLQVADATSRRNMLVPIGLGDVARSVRLADPAESFVPSLVAILIEIKLQEDHVERLGLAVFLEYLLASIGDTLLPLQRQFFEGLLAREAQLLQALLEHQARMLEPVGWPPPDLPGPGEYIPQPAPAGAGNGGAGAAERHIPVDRDLLIGFNLVPLRQRLARSLQNYQGAFSFVLGGKQADESVLRGYIVERVLKEIGLITGREYRKFEYTINKFMPLQADRLLEASIKETGAPARISEMLSESTQDLVLIFYNYDIPGKTIHGLAKSFWEGARQEAAAFVKEGGRCFIVVWVNVREKTPRIEQITSLPVPAKFEVEQLKSYVRGRLAKYRERLGEPVIEGYLLRLAQPRGHLTNTYRAIMTMIAELQEGRW